MNSIRKFWTILKRILGALLLVIYVIVALLNYSVVQSLIGSAVSAHFSKEWGGKVSVGSISVNPINHVVLQNVLLVSPTNDTIAVADKIACRFVQRPFDSHGLYFDRVLLRNVYYHLATDSSGTNLQYIIDYYHKAPTHHTKNLFTVHVNRVVLSNIHYKMTLHHDRKNHTSPTNGVDIYNMEFTNIRSRIKNVRVQNDHITCRMEKFQAHERSGFNVQRLDMNVYVAPNGISATDMKLVTDSTDINADVLLKYHSWETMSHFTDSVYIFAQFKPGTSCNSSDAAYWAPMLWGLGGRVDLEGTVYGPVSDLHAEEMLVRFGRGSEMFFDGYIVGLPNIDTTIINADIERLTTNYADIESLRRPPSFKLRTPGVLRHMGSIDVQASFIGTIKDFYAKANINSALGVVDAIAMLQYNDNLSTYTYSAEATSSNFNLARILPNEWVSHSGFSVTAQGTGFDKKTMIASVEGRLFNSVFQGNKLSEASFNINVSDAQLNTNIQITDPLIALNLTGSADWGGEYAHFKTDAQLQHADLAKLKLWTGDSSFVVDSRLHAQLEWEQMDNQFSFDNINGELSLSNTHIQRNSSQTTLDNVDAKLNATDNYKEVTLHSDIANLSANGYFDYSDIVPIVQHFYNQFIPVYYNPYSSQPIPIDYANIADANIDLNLTWTDSLNKSTLFVPDVRLAYGSTLRCNYNFTESLKMVLRSDSIQFGSIHLYDIGVDCRDAAGRYYTNLVAGRISSGNSPLMEDMRLQLASTSNDVSCDLRWDDHAQEPSQGDILLMINSTPEHNRLSVMHNNLTIHGKPWKIFNEGDILFAKHQIEVDKLTAKSDEQSVIVRSKIQKQPNDYLELSFEDFLLEQISFLIEPSGFNVNGTLNGRFSMYGFSATPYFNANLDIDDCNINNQSIGDANIRSSWNAELNQLNLGLSTDLHTEQGTLHPLTASGYISMESKDPSIDFGVSFNGFSLQTVAPLVKSFSSQIEGNLHGEFDLAGSLKKPLIHGDAFIEDGAIRVDFLNVKYTLNDSISFSNDEIRFNDFALRDPKNEVAYISGTIGHSFLKDFVFNLSLRTDNFLFMNTTAKNDEFYGHIYASANGKVTGTDNNIDITVNARTNAGSELTIPLNDKRQVKELNYISFVNNETPAKVTLTNTNLPKQHEPETNTANNLGYHLTINMNVTPDFHLAMPMQFSSVKADVAAIGHGDLQLGMASDADFSIKGNYEIGSGTMAFTLLSVFPKDFSIDEGSSINFTGDVADAMFNINAIYSQRVNLATLTGEAASSGHSQTIPVQSVVALSGTLQNPAIKFDIRLPNVDKSVEDEVFSYIDRNNDRDMLTQTMSLLLLNQFYNSTVSNNASNNNGLSGGYAVVANSVGSVVSDMVQFVNVNFDYKAATELTNQQFDVDISKEWNKFYFESTFGYGNDANALSTNTNNITGDVLLGYKINPRLHLFVFNRSNTNDYTRSDLPYKQGVGLKYTRDFDSWKELFINPSLKKKKKDY